MSFRLFSHTRCFRCIMIPTLTIVLSVCTACGDDDDLPSSSNATRPAIAGSWTDAYGGTLTISENHFSLSGTGWGYSGTVVGFNNSARHVVLRYTNAGTLLAGDEIVGRYNRIIWKNLSLSGTTATLEYQELFASEMTNSAGNFIAWPTAEAAEAATNISTWYTLATNTRWQP